MKFPPLFRKGIVDALPIFAGYFAVVFAITAAGMAKQLPLWTQLLSALLTFSGTGQTVLVQLYGNAGILSIVLTCLALNMRYLLMALAISQRIAPGTGIAKRCMIAMGITDEIVAVSLLQKQPLAFSYILGLTICSLLGWLGGTIFGGLGAHLLPSSAIAPLRLAPYAMFVAIILPAARQSRPVLFCVCLAIFFNILLHFLPTSIRPSGASCMLLSGIVAAAIGTALSPDLPQFSDAPPSSEGDHA
ncbi:MAG: AzlC family ABC transporter permease [Kiritimatiellia bacterium]